MEKVTLEEVVKQVRMLTPGEQRQLRSVLDLLLNPPSETMEKSGARRVEWNGLVITIPPPITDFAPYENRKLAEVTGKPVSEILIEERR